MTFKNSVEYLYYVLMRRWEGTAPPDRTKGVLDGIDTVNCQASRLIYVLKKVAAGGEDRVYRCLALHSRRNDGESYISQESGWMKRPCPLNDTWFLEAGMSLLQKKDIVIHGLGRLGLSPYLIRCVEDFVEGLPISKYEVKEEEANEILQRSPEPDLVLKSYFHPTMN